MRILRLFSGLATLACGAGLLWSCGGSSNASLLSLNTLSHNTSQKSSQEVSFQEFIAKFPQANLPLDITKTALEQYGSRTSSEKASWKTSKNIDTRFSKFVPGLEDRGFSREPVRTTCQYVAKLQETPEYIAVLYTKSKNYGYGYRASNPINLQVITYNLKGEIIDEKSIAYTGSLQNFATALVDKNLNITSRRYDNEYEKDINEFGYENNPVKNTRLREEKTYTISPEGTILEKNVPTKTEKKKKKTDVAS
jgi:hypothetical protein